MEIWVIWGFERLNFFIIIITIVYLTTSNSLQPHYNKTKKKIDELIDSYKYITNKSTKEKKTVKYIDS